MSNRHLSLLMTAMAVLALSACGGGGGDDDDDADDGPDDASGAGIWSGTYRIDGTTTNQQMRGVVTEEGDFALMSFNPLPARQFFGTGSTNVNAFSANAAAYLNFARTGSASLMGTVIDGTSINGSYLVNGETATISLTYQRGVYERAASLAIAQGVYSVMTAQGPVSFVVEANGAVTVNYPVPTGCTLRGTLTPPHANRNYYRLTGTFSSCGGGDGGTTALVYLDDTPPGQNNRLILFGQNQAQTISGYLVVSK